MPTETSPATTPPTSRRTFLTRTLAGTAMVGVGAAVGPLGLFSSPVAAQDGGSLALAAPLSGEDFSAFAVPLELAAVQAYLTALDTDGIDDATRRLLRRFQGHHQGVVEALRPLLPADPDLPDPTPNAELTRTATDAIQSAGDADGVLIALSDLEKVCAASHLNALGIIEEPSLAKTVSQVLATESQQAAFLGASGGADIAELTPSAVSLDGARTDLTEGVALPDADPNPTSTPTPAPPDANETGGTPGPNTPGLGEDGN